MANPRQKSPLGSSKPLPKAPRRDLLTPPIQRPTKKTPRSDPAIDNLEMIGDKVKVYSLQNLLANKRDFQVREPSRLGDVLQPWFEKSVAKPGEKLGPLMEIWLATVPPAIANRSRLIGLMRGTLTVSLDSAPVRAQLEGLLRQGLLKQLQLQAKGALFRVKTVVDGAAFSDN